MVLQALAGAAYAWVQHTWIVATWLTPAVVVANLLPALKNSEVSLRSADKALIEYSRPSVAAVSLAGILAALAGFDARPPLRLLFQVVALSYFGYLFWRF